MKRLLMTLAAAVLFAGCNTVTISSPGSLDGIDVKDAKRPADRVITVGTDGYFFLWTIPVVAGNMTEWDAEKKGLKNTTRWFSCETRLQKLHDTLFRYADSLDCDVVDIVVNDRSVSRLGLWSLEGWFSGVFGLSPVSVSGVLVPKK